MIVAMKKISVVTQSKDAASAIETLRSLGVLHVVNENAPKGRDVSALREELALIDEAIQVLSLPEFSRKKIPPKKLKIWRLTAKHVVDSWKRLDQVGEYSRMLAGIISEWEPWGDFDPEAIEELKKKDIHLRLYRVPAGGLKRFPKEAVVRRLWTAQGNVSCAVVSKGKADIPFEEISLPKMSLDSARDKLVEASEVIEEIKSGLTAHTAYLRGLSSARKPIEEALEFHEALSGMGESGTLKYIRGFIPSDSVRELEQRAKRERWAISITDPSDSDNVPTLVRNPRWISIIEPVFKLIEVVPGYRELDISLWFLLFFSVFFGILIGDAGYGLVYFFLTLFAHVKWGRDIQNRSVFGLFYILSSAAMVWGALSGTFFGQEWLPQQVKPIIPALRDDKDVQALCFLLGAVHLSIAHLWRALIRLPSVRALAQVGWFIILWGAFFLAKMLVLGDAFPAFGKWLFITGCALVLFFTDPKKNILKGIGSGFGALLLNLVNSFTDIVSYIRLFAVGLATVAVADAFNKMAMDIGYGSIVAGVATSLILLLGHVLNIVLGPMSILVHGVRLNVLEFCSHLDVNWSGFSYNPLKK